MTYGITIALHADSEQVQVKKKGYIKEDGRCKEASPFLCASTVISVQPILDELLTHNEGKVVINHFYYLSLAHYLRLPRAALDGCLLQTITIYKRQHIIQHEAILFTLWSEHDSRHFQILVEQTVDFSLALGFPLTWARNKKLANDTVQLLQTGNTLIHRLYGDAIWTLTMPGVTSQTPRFSINLLQLATLLRTIRQVGRGQDYHTIDRNCFWLVRMARLAIICLAQRAHAQDQVAIATTEEAEMSLGRCGCICLDGHLLPHDQDNVEQLVNRYEGGYQELQSNYVSDVSVLPLHSSLML